MSDAVTLDNALKVIEIASILGGGGLVAFRLGRTTSRVEGVLQAQNLILTQQSAEISDLKTETKKLGDVLTQLAVTGQRLDTIDKMIWELRHGEGYVKPRAP